MLRLVEPWGLQSLLGNCGIQSLRVQMMERGLGSGVLVITLSRGKKKKKPSFVAPAYFCGVNILVVAAFKLPVV